MPSRTEQLRRGTGYALKPSAVAKLLEEEGVALEWHLVRGSGTALFECFFWPPNQNVPHERLYLRSAAVPSAAVGQAKAYLEDHGIPQFRAWLRELLSLPTKSTRRQFHQEFTCTLQQAMAKAPSSRES